MVKTCLIVNDDGADFDVKVNLALFYEACGYSVRFAKAPQTADLLVFQRASAANTPHDVVAADVHVYDYSKTGTLQYAASLRKIRHYKVVTFDPPESRADRRATYVRGHHPIMTDLWVPRGPLPSVDYKKVHIGHRKRVASDPVQIKFERQALASTDCHFFGGGWENVGPAGTAHGVITLHEVQAVYRRCAGAFGVMYPYQRQRALSGRMWQAPLNGCRVYSEALPPGLALPGVSITDSYSEMVEPLLPVTSEQRERLVNEAAAYWQEDASRIAMELGLTMADVPQKRLDHLYWRYVYYPHLRQLLRRPFGRIKRMLRALPEKS